MRLPARLSHRKVNSHKGDFGHVFILAGSARFSGAAVLSAEAAMRSGAGLVTLGIPRSLNSAIIKIKPKEVMTLPLPETAGGGLSSTGYKRTIDFIKAIDVLAIGPGLGREKPTQALVLRVIKNSDKPQVIDADALNALVGHLNLLKAAKSERKSPRRGQSQSVSPPEGDKVTRILTPHSAEMARLLGLTTDRVQARRKEVAKTFAQDYNCIVVLKGHRTVVAGPQRCYVNNTGNPGMSTAGSGDVLTGMAAALLGQGLAAFEAAKYAVYLHGLAGDLAAKEKTEISLVASDIIAKIPEAIKMSL